MKHDGHLRTQGKCRKHEPQASVFYIYRARFFYVLCSDKTWVFDQSERVQGPIYILIIYNSHEYFIFLHHHLSTIFNMARATGAAFEKKSLMIVTQPMVNECAL